MLLTYLCAVRRKEDESKQWSNEHHILQGKTLNPTINKEISSTESHNVHKEQQTCTQRATMCTKNSKLAHRGKVIVFFSQL